MASSSNSDNPLPPSLTNLIPIKLSSSNYLLWKGQMEPLLHLQDLASHIDGSAEPPAPTITKDGNSSPNPLYSSWLNNDRRAVVLINATLTEEAMCVVVGLPTARSVWDALAVAFGNPAIERIQNLQDQLRSLTRGTKSVAEFGRVFKGFCDQLAAVGSPVPQRDQMHWFLRGLGPAFESFSTTTRSVYPTILLPDLIAKAVSHDMFYQSLHTSAAPTVAFPATSDRNTHPYRGRGGRSGAGYRGRGGRPGGRGSNTYRRPPLCQLCRQNGHFASSCPSLSTYAYRALPPDDQVANAFLSQCSLSDSRPDWFVDSGATDHMTPAVQQVTNTTPASGPSNKTGSGSRSM
ncbi:putative RNA-directed DNA polymerase [Helianthus debilis subsp. tardiflorus]